jgi:hypothetical protein
MVAESRKPAARSKVVGLGAPISVRIVLESAEIPVLFAAIDAEVARYAGRGGNGGPWDDQIGELVRMRAELDGADASEHVVVWPTALAHEVVRKAVELAERSADESKASRAARAATGRTRRDLDAVDLGGLEDVWL